MNAAATRALFGIFLAALTSLPLMAYAHFLHYDSTGQPLPEKFNLLQIPSKTVTFFVSDAGPTAYSPNDSFPSVLNQIRQATEAWNGVSTSDLRVAFGGIYTIGTQDNSPGGEVVFEDLPPGVLAYSGPTTCEDNTPTGPAACQSQAPPPGASYLPILHSTMHMSNDLTKLPGPSFSETFYLVSVHEMGHALGLQHTFTSSTMSTIVTRATSLSHPLDADDRAGISDLYPAAAFQSQFGSISGTVTYTTDNSPVHMASVVAVSSTAPSVSALTLPDGTYQINGITPGQYVLYVHPLPPTANIQSPVDSNDNPVNPTAPFNALLYPATQALASASQVSVTAGQVSSGFNFSVTPRADVPIYDVALYSYFYPNPSDQTTYNAAHPAYVSENSPGVNPAEVSVIGTGLIQNGSLVSGLSAQFMGGTASVSGTQTYSSGGSTYLYLTFAFSSFGAPGPQHLLFSTPDYLYLLPSAVNIVVNQPPSLSSLSANSDGTLTISGQGLAADTQVYFDALPSTIQNRNLGTGQITLTPPAGASGQVATLTAYNSDGQNSMFLQALSPQTYTYWTLPTPSLSITPTSLPAGAEASVDIEGVNTSFVQGRTTFGFGSHDVIVRRTFVLSPTHSVVDIGMPTGAAQISTQVTALTDFQMATDVQPFVIQAPQSGLPAAIPILFNAIPNQSGLFPGAVVSLYGANLQAGSSTPAVTLGDQTANILYSSPTLINLTIPDALSTGLTTLLVNNGSQNSYPVTVSIDPPEPVIVGVQSSFSAVSGSNPAQIGIPVNVLLTGLASAGSVIDPSRITVDLGGVSLPAITVSPVSGSSAYDVQFDITAAVPSGSAVPLIVYIDGRSSVADTIAVSNP